MLVAEDRDEDVQILQLAFDRAKVSLPLRFVKDGDEVIEYLTGAGRFADRNKHPLPTLLLLDLNMPRKNGFQVLEWLRLQAGLRRLLVVVFTSSAEPEDINRAFDLGANSYLVKPVDFGKLQEVGRHLEQYWTKLNRAPDCAVASTIAGVATRVLLRDSEKARYFAGSDKWANDPKGALNFERSERAVQAALGMGLKRFEVVIEGEAQSVPGPARLKAAFAHVKRTILVVEDRDDAELIRVAPARAGFEESFQTVGDPATALRYLEGQREYADRTKFPFPHLILLDHKMPGDGWPVIEWVRRRRDLALLPVVVFSGSDDPKHRQKATDLGANAYHVKPQNFEEFTEVVRRIVVFWLR